MSKPKPGDLLTYTADTERTGVVLDAAPVGFRVEGAGRYWEHIVMLPGFAVWVHREDGTFDKVKMVVTGKRAGEMAWLGHFTAGGQEISAVARSAETA